MGVLLVLGPRPTCQGPRGPCADCFSPLLLRTRRFRGGPAARVAMRGRAQAPLATLHSCSTGELSHRCSVSIDVSFLFFSQEKSLGPFFSLCDSDAENWLWQGHCSQSHTEPGSSPDSWGWGKAVRLLFSTHPSSAQPVSAWSLRPPSVRPYSHPAMPSRHLPCRMLLQALSLPK